MQVVCEATQNPSVAVQVGAFECLVKIMALYYDKMAFYMEQALFGVRGIRHSTFLDTDSTSSSRSWA
jgi:importin subunit beta-1